MALVAQSPKFLEPIGHYVPLVKGVTVMASGTADVDLGAFFYKVEGAIGCIADAATGVGQFVTFSCDGSVLTIETMDESGSLTGTSLVSWLAWGSPKA